MGDPVPPDSPDKRAAGIKTSLFQEADSFDI